MLLDLQKDLLIEKDLLLEAGDRAGVISRVLGAGSLLLMLRHIEGIVVGEVILAACVGVLGERGLCEKWDFATRCNALLVAHELSGFS